MGIRSYRTFWESVFYPIKKVLSIFGFKSKQPEFTEESVSLCAFIADHSFETDKYKHN